MKTSTRFSISYCFSVSPSRLEDRVSLVDKNINFTSDMSVRQTILFHSLMREPGTLTRGRDTKVCDWLITLCSDFLLVDDGRVG